MTSPDPLAAFCYARLDEEEADALESKNAPEGAVRYRPVGRRAEALSWQAGENLVLRRVAVLRSLVADCEKALRYPANTPMYNLTCRNLAAIASIWEDHPDYAQVTAGLSGSERQGTSPPARS